MIYCPFCDGQGIFLGGRMFKTIWKCIFVKYILMVLNFIVIKFNGDIRDHIC